MRPSPREWIAANRGATFSRQNGTATYEVVGLKYKHFSGRTFVEVVCRDERGRVKHVPFRDMVRMRRV